VLSPRLGHLFAKPTNPMSSRNTIEFACNYLRKWIALAYRNASVVQYRDVLRVADAGTGWPIQGELHSSLCAGRGAGECATWLTPPAQWRRAEGWGCKSKLELEPKWLWTPRPTPNITLPPATKPYRSLCDKTLPHPHTTVAAARDAARPVGLAVVVVGTMR